MTSHALASLGLLLAISGQVPAQRADRPNIVFIMTDDHAAHAISAYGSRVNVTPHIDRLAREGALLANVFATNSICTPSRAAILTGQYAHVNGVTMFNRFDSSRVTVARLLQRAGYHTGMIGKWHLGSDPVGFDRWEILPGQGAYFDPVLYTATSETKYTGRYATDVITDLGIAFMRDRPRGKPFFLMLHHKAPHRHWQPDSAHGARFRDRWIPEPATLWDDYATRTDAIRENQQRIANDLTRRDLKLEPPTGLSAAQQAAWLDAAPDTVTIARDGATVTLTGEALTRWKYQRYMQDYLATVQSVDDNVGRVLDFLDRSGLARNTIVIYTSDQGFFLGDHGMYDKRFMYEESLRMPFVVRWPGRIPPGTRSDAMALNVDFAPTFLEAAGVPVPPDMQGRSLVPVLRDRVPADWRTSMYYRYYHDPGHHNTRAHYGVRTLTHKLIYFWKKDQWELFDLRADPFELHNLYGQPGHEAITVALKAELSRVKAGLGDRDQLADVQYPSAVDGSVAQLRSVPPPLGGAATLAITNVAVIDVRESDARRAVRPNQTVLVSGDRITRVGPALATAGARVVDGTGKYLIPGLWDMHVHTLSRSRVDLFFPLFLAHGITGVRDMGSTGRDAQAALEEFGFFRQWRDEIDAGRRLGPRIVAAGMLVDGAPPVFPFALSVGNAEQARAAVRDLQSRGAQFIKVYGLLGREAYFAIADESRRLGLPFAGHVPNAVSAFEAADAGQRSIEHLNNVLLAASSREDELRAARLAALAEPNPSRVVVQQNAAIVESYSADKARALFERFKRNGTWHAPTLTVIRSFALSGDTAYRASFADRMKYLTPDTRLRWRPEQNPVLQAYLADSAIMAGARSIYRRSVQFVGELHQAGVPILAATDTPNPWVFPGSGLHDELALLVEGGLTPLDALRSATWNPARFLGAEATMGSVEAGKVADLVLLDANPLENIAHTRGIRAVVARGRFLDRAALDSLLSRVESLARR